MFKVSLTAKRLMLIMLCISTLSFSISLLFIKEWVEIFAFLKGITFGTLFSVLKVILMERTINKSIQMGDKMAQGYAVMNYTFRYFLTGAMLVVAALEPSISLLGAIIGLISLQFAAYALKIVFKDDKV